MLESGAPAHEASPTVSAWQYTHTQGVATHDSQRCAQRVDDRVGPRILSLSLPGCVKLLRGRYGTQEPMRLQWDRWGRFRRLVDGALPRRSDDPRGSGSRAGRAGRAGREATRALSWHHVLISLCGECVGSPGVV
eukprot:scaffold78503_cov63-Phaeocystis_antarctica.AAC.2